MGAKWNGTGLQKGGEEVLILALESKQWMGDELSGSRF